MSTRTAVLAIVLAFTAALSALTAYVMARNGPDVLTALSLLVLAMFAFGAVGALRHPPDA
jgi:drug/metabolite transporter (DMT)-like permease